VEQQTAGVVNSGTDATEWAAESQQRRIREARTFALIRQGGPEGQALRAQLHVDAYVWAKGLYIDWIQNELGTVHDRDPLLDAMLDHVFEWTELAIDKFRPSEDGTTAAHTWNAYLRWKLMQKNSLKAITKQYLADTKDPRLEEFSQTAAHRIFGDQASDQLHAPSAHDDHATQSEDLGDTLEHLLAISSQRGTTPADVALQMRCSADQLETMARRIIERIMPDMPRDVVEYGWRRIAGYTPAEIRQDTGIAEKRLKEAAYYLRTRLKTAIKHAS
jgi:hypothetical protein